MLNHHVCYKTDTDKPPVCSLWLTSCCHTVYCPLSKLCVAAGILCAFSHTTGSWPCFCASLLQSSQQCYLRGDLAHVVCRLNAPPVISGSQLLISLWFTSYKEFLVLPEKVPQKVLVGRDFFRAQK